MSSPDYELWDLAAGNLMGMYPSEEGALAEVRAGIRDDGAEAWRTVGLRVVAADNTTSRTIATGDALIALASPAQEHATAHD